MQSFHQLGARKTTNTERKQGTLQRDCSYNAKEKRTD